jgi:hypothetical protein
MPLISSGVALCTSIAERRAGGLQGRRPAGVVEGAALRLLAKMLTTRSLLQGEAGSNHHAAAGVA